MKALLPDLKKNTNLYPELWLFAHETMMDFQTLGNFFDEQDNLRKIFKKINAI
jgi:hypothetical protein